MTFIYQIHYIDLFIFTLKKDDTLYQIGTNVK